MVSQDSGAWQVYPRPQLKRNSYVNLNGWWDFAICDAEEIPQKYDLKIPFLIIQYFCFPRGFIQRSL